jgi:polysaccharide export outer membrane protein
MKRAVMVAALLFLTGCPQHPVAGAKPPRAAPSAEYLIGSEDVLEVYLWGQDALSRKVPVRPDGKISLPLLNDVRAAGLTPMQLRDRLAVGFRAFIPDVEVSVIVQEVHSAKVAVFGEVVHPGRYELRGPSTLLDMLAEAGGFTAFASHSPIVILRQGSAGTTKFAVTRSDLAGEGGTVPLQPGDMVVVR